MKEKVLGGLQKFSKAMISSVLYLPAIGMVMVVCNIFTNANITNALPFLKQDWLYIPFKVIYDALLSIFANLGPIFAIGIAFGLAKKKKEHAALVAFMSLFVYLAAQKIGLDNDTFENTRKSMFFEQRTSRYCTKTE